MTEENKKKDKIKFDWDKGDKKTPLRQADERTKYYVNQKRKKELERYKEASRERDSKRDS